MVGEALVGELVVGADVVGIAVVGVMDGSDVMSVGLMVGSNVGDEVVGDAVVPVDNMNVSH